MNEGEKLKKAFLKPVSTNYICPDYIIIIKVAILSSYKFQNNT